MAMPNFVIIGAMKAGTTSLYSYLRQHPEIYMSAVKEPDFFAYEGQVPNFPEPYGRLKQRQIIHQLGAYQALFDGVTDQKAVGEASTAYLYDPRAPERLRHYIPDVKLIVVLRNPVERAYSHFVHFVRDGFEPLYDFERALEAEEQRIREGWNPHIRYKERGFYFAPLSRYLKIFDREQLKIFLFEDLLSDDRAVLRDIFCFLQVDAAFMPNLSRRMNAAAFPRHRRWHALVVQPHPLKSVLRPLLPVRLRQQIFKRLKFRNLSAPPALAPEMRERLREIYREDILKTQELIGRDLSRWLTSD